jgi:hypothetical protein
LNGVQEAGSSNLLTRTSKKVLKFNGFKAFFFFKKQVRKQKGKQNR